MKRKMLLINSVLVAVATAASCATAERAKLKTSGTPQPQSTAHELMRHSAAVDGKQQGHPSSRGGAAAHDGHGHEHEPAGSRVPAFEVDPASLKKLPPTLAPEKFIGKQREAYQAVREIPKTIAQLPCYCYCDKGFGHKSLHTCYVDDHAAHCAVCVEEVLMAYRLEKEEKLKPEQIRERIVAKYAEKN